MDEQTRSGNWVTPTEGQVADLLRLVKFTLERSRTSLVANCRPEHIDFIERDVDRITEVLAHVKAMLVHLPAEEPMSPEKMEKVGAVVGAALRKREGTGTAEELREAMKAAWPTDANGRGVPTRAAAGDSGDERSVG